MNHFSSFTQSATQSASGFSSRKGLLLLAVMLLAAVQTTSQAQGNTQSNATTRTATSSTKRLVSVQGAPIGDPVKGPLTFRGNPVKGSVSTLQIQAAQAVLTPPAGQTLVASKGRLRADFSGDVEVSRGRLTARGAALAYDEATGQGVLSGQPSAVFVPESNNTKDNKKEEPVQIKANQMSLDIDNNVSVSTGNVVLVSGIQKVTADKLVFDEDRELAQLTGSPVLTRSAQGNQKELVISGKDVRVITSQKLLYITGGVKLTQGNQVSTGDAVYYDDNKNVAYIIGNAVSINTKTGLKQTAPASGYLEQRTDLARVTAKNGKPSLTFNNFKMVDR